jgi:hypothetical protein
VKEELFAGGEHKVLTAIHTLQGLILKFHSRTLSPALRYTNPSVRKANLQQTLTRYTRGCSALWGKGHGSLRTAPMPRLGVRY